MAEFNFNPDNVYVPVRKSTAKEEITDLESALAYVNERVAEFDKKGWKDCPWIKETEDGGYMVQVNLFNMPLYWTYETVKNADGSDKMITLRNADMTVYKEVPQLKPGTMYKVSSAAEGKAMIEALASGENDALNERLAAAATALPEVLSKELPDINTRAAEVYAERGHVEKHGAFAEPNEENPKTKRMVIGKEKQNAMNSAKQKARNDLGYSRYRETA